MIGQSTAHSVNRGGHKSRGLGRWFSRWPVVIYRLHLGWLMGRNFMLVTHRGRRSGKVRQTGVMVLRFDPTTSEAVVVAGSPNADWYRNIQAAPAMEVAIGRTRFQPVQRFLTADEIAAALAWSRRRHPFAARVQTLFFGWPWAASDESLLKLAQSLGGVAFSPCHADDGVGSHGLSPCQGRDSGMPVFTI